MPLIDVRCVSCGAVTEVMRPLSMWPQTPVCPKCECPTEQIHLPKGQQSYAPAVVVYKAPDGTYRFPPTDDPHSRSAKEYARLGYERQEFRGFAEVRRLESSVTKQQASEMRRRVERQCEAYERGMSERRREVRTGLEQGFTIRDVTGRRKLVRMGEHGKDLLRAAMARNDAKPSPRFKDPGFFVDVYSTSRGNRDEARRPDGKRWKD